MTTVTRPLCTSGTGGDHSASSFGNSDAAASEGSPPAPAPMRSRDLAKSSSWIRSISSSVMPFPLAFLAFLARSPCESRSESVQSGLEA